MLAAHCIFHFPIILFMMMFLVGPGAEICRRHLDRYPHRDLWFPGRVRLGNGIHTVEFSSVELFCRVLFMFVFFAEFFTPPKSSPRTISLYRGTSL